MLPYSGLWPVKIIWLKNNLAVSLSGLESNFYGGSDSTISLSSMNTNRCAHSTGKPHSVDDVVHHHISHREVDYHVKHRFRITLIGCNTGRLEPCSIWWRQLVPQAAMCSLALA